MAIAGLLDGAVVFGELGVFEADLACGGESVGISAVAGGQDAIEHIDTGANGVINITFVTYAH